MDVRSARRTRVFAVHCFDHGRRDRAVLARRNEQQRRALWVRKIDGISDAQRRLKIDAAGCRHDIAVIGAALFALRQRVGDRRGKALKRHRRNAAPTTPHQEDGKRGPNRGNARQHAAIGCGVSKAIGSTPANLVTNPIACGICNLNAAPLPRENRGQEATIKSGATSRPSWPWVTLRTIASDTGRVTVPNHGVPSANAFCAQQG